MKLVLARALLVSGLILLVGCVTAAYPQVRTHRRCTIAVEPRTVQCADGHMYIIHDSHWQDLGPLAPLPGIPKA